ncbi:helix-turn-helix domain-containing protein [Flavobacterium limi]|uniref:Transcriptional regulator n=1 Tax=Flavobacterium limi TaxID=2045105 RepID=A0ABQ1UZJ7_9FLAO|nr:helix-turn-helix domain-containing protein [Flavobacterium limi]GGF29441.1 transcriptional regulator [Flavobacterium limi]
MNPLSRIIIIILLSIHVAGAQSGNIVFSPINVLQGLSDNQVRYILQLSDGRMVFKTSGNLNLYDGANFKYIHQTAAHVFPLKGYDGFYRIYKGGDSLLWIKDTHKLMCVDLRTEKYIPTPEFYFKNKGFKKTVEDLFIDSNSRLWLLNMGRLYKNNSSEFIHVKANDGNLQDLASKKNNLYCFYSTGAVVCYDLKTKRKHYSISAYSSAEYANFKNTSMVVAGNKGFYQLRNGTKGGFFFFDIQKRSWKKILETSYTLNTLAVTADQKAYISCKTGIWIIDCLSGEKRYIPTLKKVDGGTINTEISTVFYDKQGGLWLGTFNQGLLYYHPSRYKFNLIGHSYFHVKDSKDITVESFAEDNKGTIFIKCSDLIYQYHHAAEDKIILVPSVAVPKEVLKKFNQNKTSYGRIHTSLSDVRGWKWTGTQDGLKLFIPKKKKEKLFYTQDGLSNNFVHALLEDRNKNIWVTTSSGITKLQIDSVSQKISFTKFTSHEGTLEGEYSDGAVFQASDGTLYFGGINGFNTLKTDNEVNEKLPFRPVFTNLFSRGEKIETGFKYDGRIILQQTASNTQKVELSHEQNFLTFEFSALNYKNPSQTRYRYQLVGIDNGWRESSAGSQNENIGTGSKLKASYTNLQHGKYIFKVMSSGSRDQSSRISELEITIHAPWWKTTSAYILFTLFLIGLIGTGIYLYISATRKKLEQSYREDLLLVRIKNLIEQCNYLEAEKDSYLSQTNVIESSIQKNENKADEAFLAKALEQVEKNLGTANYSVEDLSRDLCMDRTGLYRKLIALLDKPPSMFIRNVRLQRAAGLILEGELSISEITEKVGFSSPSYMSKCFQEMYGCKPSEYAEKSRKST